MSRPRLDLPAAWLLTLALGAVSVLGPHPWLGLGDIRAAFADPDSNSALLLFEARLPRLLLAMLVGAALAVAGLVMQTLSRNPLATPSILGIGNGASLGLVIAIAALPNLSEPGAIGASFLGALGSAAVIGAIGLRPGLGGDRSRLVVGGSILGALEGSVVTAIVFFNTMQNELLGWTLGRLLHVDWVQVLFAAPVVAAGTALAAALVDRLEAMRLGHLVAKSLGVPFALVQTGALTSVVLLAGGSVAAAGPVAFVGLIVPHLIRPTSHRSPLRRLHLCAVAGAALTASADVLARLTSTTRAIPLGIWTMAMGSLLFFSLSLRDPARPTSEAP